MAQLVFSQAVWDRLTFEEIAESIRNPYWVSQGELYDGISSNVVFYKALDLYYRAAGFNLFAAKEFRLILSLVSIGVVVFLLCRLGQCRMSTAIALMAAVLSPTLLYFSTCQASFGIDLQAFPIAAAIWLASLHRRGLLSAILLGVTTSCVVLIGAAFPPGLFYLPAVILVDLSIQYSRGEGFRNFIQVASVRIPIAGIGILLGLVVPFLLVENPLTLLYDPNTGSGIFRGGGNPTYHLLPILAAVGRTLADLFVAGDSYQFWLPYPEFGSPLAWVSLSSMLIIFLKAGLAFGLPRSADFLLLLKRPNFRVGLFGVILLGTFLVLSHVSPNLPGLRRSAGMLVAIYLFYYISIDLVLSRELVFSKWSRGILLTALCFLPANHLVQMFRNIEELPAYSRDGYPDWLKTDSSAEESLETLYGEIHEGRPLTCAEVPAECRYSAPFAALNLLHKSRKENAGTLEVYAEDPNTGNYILVDRSLWRDHYWLH